MIAQIAQPVVQLAMPAVRQGTKDAIRIGSALTVLYVGIAAAATIGYGAYLGGSHTYRGARNAGAWVVTQLRRAPLVATRHDPVADAATKTINGTAVEVPA